MDDLGLILFFIATLIVSYFAYSEPTRQLLSYKYLHTWMIAESSEYEFEILNSRFCGLIKWKSIVKFEGFVRKSMLDIYIEHKCYITLGKRYDDDDWYNDIRLDQ